MKSTKYFFRFHNQDLIIQSPPQLRTNNAAPPDLNASIPPQLHYNHNDLQDYALNAIDSPNDNIFALIISI